MLRTWPLTTVRRWVAGPNSFTLDFGDAADYYSAQTDEGEAISKLVAEYIDIVLKKKKGHDQRASVGSTSQAAEVYMNYSVLTGPSLSFHAIALAGEGRTSAIC